MQENIVAWVNQKREDGAVLLMMEEMTGQDGLYVNERYPVEVRLQVVRVQRFRQ